MAGKKSEQKDKMVLCRCGGWVHNGQQCGRCLKIAHAS